jgi:glycosyltransferase involved in cell wall biosynthesis
MANYCFDATAALRVKKGDVSSSARPLCVAFVDQSGDSIGGAERSLQLLLQNLPRTIDAVAVLFSDGAYARELRAQGLRVIVVPLSQTLLTAQREGFSPIAIPQAVLAVARLRGELKKLRVDIVYTNTVKAHFLAGMAARIAGITSIAHLRDILDGVSRVWLASAVRSTSKERIAISSAVARAYRLPKTTIVPNPLNLDAYRDVPTRSEARHALDLPEDVPIVGIVGRINRWKGQDRFLRAAQIVAQDSSAHFAIVGAPVFRDADFNDELRSLVTNLGLAGRVHFVPWLEDPRIAYAALDVHCNASTREPFGRTIIEAAAMGVPTISFDDGGASDATSPDLHRDIVASDDLRAYASAILAYLKDPSRLSKAAEIARAFSRTFDAPLHASRIAAILDNYRSRHNASESDT